MHCSYVFLAIAHQYKEGLQFVKIRKWLIFVQIFSQVFWNMGSYHVLRKLYIIVNVTCILSSLCLECIFPQFLWDEFLHSIEIPLYFFIQSLNLWEFIVVVVLPFSSRDSGVGLTINQRTPDSQVHGANMGPTWVLSASDGPHVGPMNLAIRDTITCLWQGHKCSFLLKL